MVFEFRQRGASPTPSPLLVRLADPLPGRRGVPDLFQIPCNALLAGPGRPIVRKKHFPHPYAVSGTGVEKTGVGCLSTPNGADVCSRRPSC